MVRDENSQKLSSYKFSEA